MKMKSKFIVLTLSLCLIISGCSSNAEVSKKSNEDAKPEVTTTPLEQKADTNQKNTSIVLTIKDKKFNLEQQLDSKELSGFDAQSLAILRNGIYAKHGYIFNKKEYTDYFSAYDWYKPISNNVESKLTSGDLENIKKITNLEGKNQPKVKNSKDDKDFLNANKVDFQLNSKNETLYIIKETINTSEPSNKATKVTLKIKNSQVEFKSIWNDGLRYSIVDFDDSDSDIDIYITQFGTDIGCTTYIYKYDGTKIIEYGKFQHVGKHFSYDEKGNIYYSTLENLEFNEYYNYKTKQSGDITDANLKKELNNK